MSDTIKLYAIHAGKLYRMPTPFPAVDREKWKAAARLSYPKAAWFAIDAQHGRGWKVAGDNLAFVVSYGAPAIPEAEAAKQAGVQIPASC